MDAPSPFTGPDDVPRLLRASQDGDRAALEELLRRYLPDVRGFVRRNMGPLLSARESESDVLQSVCGDLLAAHGLTFADEAAFRGWLYAATLNKLRNHDRHFHAQKRDAAREEPLPTDGDGTARTGTPSRELIGREQLARVDAALGQLPEHYREVVRLARFEGLTYAQIAVATGRTEDSVRNVLARALTRLSELLDE